MRRIFGSLLCRLIGHKWSDYSWVTWQRSTGTIATGIQCDRCDLRVPPSSSPRPPSLSKPSLLDRLAQPALERAASREAVEQRVAQLAAQRRGSAAAAAIAAKDLSLAVSVQPRVRLSVKGTGEDES